MSILMILQSYVKLACLELVFSKMRFFRILVCHLQTRTFMSIYVSTTTLYPQIPLTFNWNSYCMLDNWNVHKIFFSENIGLKLLQVLSFDTRHILKKKMSLICIVATSSLIDGVLSNAPCSSFCLLVCLSLALSLNISENFPYFLVKLFMNLGHHNGTKLMEPDFEKILWDYLWEKLK